MRSTVGENPTTGTDDLEFLVDAGPTITVVSPPVASAVASKSPQTFQFKVVPSPLEDDDPGAEVDSVKLTVRGVEYVAKLVQGTSDQYQVEIDFTDTTKVRDAAGRRNVARGRGNELSREKFENKHVCQPPTTWTARVR